MEIDLTADQLTTAIISAQLSDTQNSFSTEKLDDGTVSIHGEKEALDGFSLHLACMLSGDAIEGDTGVAFPTVVDTMDLIGAVDEIRTNVQADDEAGEFVLELKPAA